ncbi:nitrous oxide reductase accessory protein NosL [Geothrix sp. PMB-07]|uniref:nitrous oxide reductase accessory protein NosL n=1 Tax=Geothrix sp. PMB-07 TaxID=3068640 RepID=UPI002740D326|nr:nitrous oxide reductase accessory protein NosL [Geothrix sp. PMB-07]WLT32288.1 nitrous oxide reductase accessory protein NosL [Geothrix sp. PMB-07]
MLRRLCTLGLAFALAAPGWADSKPLPPKGNCAVCGMYVANFPDWAAAVVFKDGAQAWFDGPKDLFHYLLDLKRYAKKRSGADIDAILVKDYYALKHIDARKAFFVLRSDILGPMGQELVPFATEAEAKAFLKDHKGQRILSFPDVTQAALKSLE